MKEEQTNEATVDPQDSVIRVPTTRMLVFLPFPEFKPPVAANYLTQVAGDESWQNYWDGEAWRNSPYSPDSDVDFTTLVHWFAAYWDEIESSTERDLNPAGSTE